MRALSSRTLRTLTSWLLLLALGVTLPVAASAAVNGKIGLQLNLDETTSASTAAVKATIQMSPAWAVASGTASGQADKLWCDQRTVNSGANEDLDVSGSLAGYFGTVVFVKVKAVVVEVVSGAGTLTISRPASNGLPLFAAASDALAPMGPGDLFLFTKLAAGVTVTAGTGDLINVAAASANMTYRICIVGTSA